MNALIARNIRKSYPTPAEDLVVLEDITLELAPGQNLAIVGPSGTGKSTMLHILGTLDRPTSGSFTLNGTDPFQLSESGLAAFRNQNIGFVFQDHNLLPHLNVLQNVLVPSLASAQSSSTYQARAIELIQRVGLASRLHHLPSELSGGEKGRVAVARALLMKPSLILADEPTGNLDPENAHRIASLLIELQKSEQAMMIVVTHSLEIADMLQTRGTLIKGRISLS